MSLQGLPLGKKSTYIAEYNPKLLFPIPRKNKRDEIDISSPLPFTGYDIWNAYELSWLNNKGKPQVAIAQFIIPCESTNIVESKSFKLYLNSFNNTKFSTTAEVQDRLTRDLSNNFDADITINLFSLASFDGTALSTFTGECLDNLDIECDTYTINPSYLTIESNDIIEETLYTDLLKSNCLITSQPDWGSLQIHYTGKKINHEGLLKYIISFRNHNEFHEQCVERIFTDIMKTCKPKKLTVHACYTRRGGLDINPIRSTESTQLLHNIRLPRQ